MELILKREKGPEKRGVMMAWKVWGCAVLGFLAGCQPAPSCRESCSTGEEVPSASILTLETIQAVCGATLEFSQDDTKGTLVVFDLDNTLVTPTDPALSLASLKAHRATLDALMEGFSKEQKEEVINYALVASDVRPVEPETLDCFKTLQAQCPVIALTASLAGKVGDVPSFEAFRLRRLKKLGFVFSQDLCAERRFVLEVPSLAEKFSRETFRGHRPTYDHGIIFGHGSREEKGAVLLAFLHRVKASHRPRRIVFVDDSKTNVTAMAKALSEAGIPHLCIHYTQVQAHPGESVSRENFVAFAEPVVRKVAGGAE